MPHNRSSFRGFASAVARATLLLLFVVMVSSLAGPTSQRVSRCESAADVELLEVQTIVSEGIGRRHCRSQRAPLLFSPALSHSPASLTRATGVGVPASAEHRQRNGVGGPLRC